MLSKKNAKLIKFFESVMDDPRESAKSRMTAALRLQEFYLAFEQADARTKSHARKLELRALQIENPNLPLPAADLESKPVVDDTVDEALAFIRKGGTGAATV